MEKIYEIGREFYMIKSREKEFHRNIFIKRFNGKGKTVNMLLDPGTRLDLETLTEILKELIGGFPNVDLIFISHQDPDVSANLIPILANAPKAIVLSSMDTIRLLKMYGIDDKRMKPIDSLIGRIATIKKTEHKVQFIPAYYCHFRGSMMIFDFESRVLYSGDFLAGLNSRSGEGIYADDNSWRGISLFHQIYMPTKRAIQDTVSRICLLNPMPEVIAPQHGDIIRGEYVLSFLNKVSNLDVGIDLMRKEAPGKRALISSINAFLSQLKEKYPGIWKTMIKAFKKPNSYITPFIFKDEVLLDIKISTQDAIDYLWNTLENLSPLNILEDIRLLYAVSLEKFGLTPPSTIIEEIEEEIFEV